MKWITDGKKIINLTYIIRCYKTIRYIRFEQVKEADFELELEFDFKSAKKREECFKKILKFLADKDAALLDLSDYA